MAQQIAELRAVAVATYGLAFGLDIGHRLAYTFSRITLGQVRNTGETTMATKKTSKKLKKVKKLESTRPLTRR
jgi:hypothetical protein